MFSHLKNEANEFGGMTNDKFLFINFYRLAIEVYKCCKYICALPHTKYYINICFCDCWFIQSYFLRS